MMEDALARVMLDPSYLDRMVDKSLSGGERKRIELASVFLMHPMAFSFGEPDSGVDLSPLGDHDAFSDPFRGRKCGAHYHASGGCRRSLR
jgi:Fe-S cluster assembly ATPase SufC